MQLITLSGEALVWEKVVTFFSERLPDLMDILMSDLA